MALVATSPTRSFRPLAALPHVDRPPERIGLVLEGGGNRGAFTAGFLQEILPYHAAHGDRIEVVAGTSAGALNGAVLASGLAVGGAEEACRRLTGLWNALPRHTAVHAMMMFGLLPPPNPIELMVERHAPGFHAPEAPHLLVNAYNEHNDNEAFFSNRPETMPGAGALCRRGIAASAALPGLFPAVKINGIPYSDGYAIRTAPLRPAAEAHPELDRIISVELLPDKPDRVRPRITIDEDADWIQGNTTIVLDRPSLPQTEARNMPDCRRTDRPYLQRVFELGRAAGRQYVAARKAARPL